jgi:hypothetical protein
VEKSASPRQPSPGHSRAVALFFAEVFFARHSERSEEPRHLAFAFLFVIPKGSAVAFAVVFAF